MEFVWNKIKATNNLRKHDIDFTDAVAVFEDELALTIEDRDHDEERFVTLGRDACGRLLVVVYAYLDRDVTRIISARKANKIEARVYQKKVSL